MKTILLVDDDPDVLLEYRDLLRAHGYNTVSAVDGASAIRQALEHNLDLVILDLGLPAGSGFDVLEWFRSKPALAKLPRIVVSGVRSEVKSMAMALGAAAYLQKPVQDAELLALIKQAIEPPD